MSKIAVRGGHTELCTGARALLDELTEDRKIKDSVIKYLKQLGEDVLDCTPPINYTSNMTTDMAYGVNKANNWGADLFVSIHLNKAYDSYNGALGTEVCVYSTYDIAQRVVDGISSLGFENRGQKIRTGLYELKHTDMKSMIIETCFVEATEDVALYKRIGPDAIGKKIAESIVNKKIEDNSNNNDNEEEKKVKGIVIYSNDVDRRAAEYLADYLKLPTISSKTNFDYTTVEQSGIYAVGGDKGTYTSYLKDENFIAGSDRYETIKAVLKRIGKL